MRDTQKWRAAIAAGSAAFFGGIIAITVMNLIWKLSVEPARCDGGRLPDGSFVDPLCVQPLAPAWLTILVSMVGALAGYWIYRRVKVGRTADEP